MELLQESRRLREEFRAVMRLPVTPREEEALRSRLQGLMSGLFALEATQDGETGAAAETRNMLLACRLRLRKLKNELASVQAEADFARQGCELRGLVEDLCCACDLVLSPLGRSVLFDPPAQEFPAAAAPQELSWLLLNMICNAALHTDGGDIRVALRSPVFGRRARAERASSVSRPRSAVLQVESEGTLDLERLHERARLPGSGSAAMLRSARLHQASLLWANEGGAAVCSLRLPLGGDGRLRRHSPPDFVALLCDKLSPVYTALAPCGTRN
ncbi:MAG: hypothetical protein LBJ11_04085 [Oscillospiraceae bacterium]|jgi:hypothetical protein|nr:hypothetical protein [Oscillospiraceae bacterium]